MRVILVARLCIMMFLQYAIWGAWTTVLAADLGDLMRLSGVEIGWVYAALWLACIISPFIGGQIVDRWFPTQIFLAIAHLVGGGVMIFMSKAATYGHLLGLMFLWALLYAPTLALTNSLAFHHLREAEKQFGFVRVWGTLGWIVVGWVLTWMRKTYGNPTLETGFDCLWLGGVCSLILGFFCFLLPHTPPKRVVERPFAFLEAIKLLKLVPGFAVFMGISFVVTTELQFYYMLSAPFLHDIGVPKEWLSAVKTVAQIAEIVTMAAVLPVLLPRIGMRACLAIGVIAWPIRYIFFAIGKPLWLVVASLSLHGIGYTFFFVVSQIYVDRVAPPDIRGSAQSLLTFVTLGVGNFLGTLFTGWIRDVFTRQVGGNPVVNWPWVFMVPCALTVSCAIAFLLWFKEPPKDEARTQKI